MPGTTQSGGFSLATNFEGTLAANNGGTGVSNNASSTITVSGAFGLTITLSAVTSVTLPTSGTLATLAGIETFTNKTLTAPTLSTVTVSAGGITFTGAQTLATSTGNLDISTNAASGQIRLNTNGTGLIVIRPGGAEQWRFASTGQLASGGTTTSFGINGILQIHTTVANTNSGPSNVHWNATAANYANYSFGGSTSGVVASFGAVVSGTTVLGAARWFGDDGGAAVEAAAIRVVARGTIASTRVPGSLQFYTGTDAAPTVLTEGMRLDQAQILYLTTLQVGGTIGTSAAGLQLTGTGTTITAGGSFTVTTNLTVSDAGNIILGATTGTKIGTATTQKLGFYNSAPVAQPATTGETVGFTAGTGSAVNDASTFTGNVGATAYRLSDVVKHLKLLGLIAA